MKSLLRFGSVLVFTLLIISVYSCKDDNEDASFDLNINGLEDLGADYRYEGWLIVDGSPVTTGLFTVDADGVMSSTSFTVADSDLESATTFVLTIEPFPDTDPAPSSVHIVAGDFDNGTADLTVSHPAALGTDFSAASGGFIIATPTSVTDTDEASGVWFLDNSSGAPEAGLDLPALPEGWMYEGWAVIDGAPVTTGRFREASGSDLSAPFSGDQAGPPYPGEDFLNNAPAGLTFPTNLSGAPIVISVEPSPDNSAAPFLLKPLFGNAGTDVHSFTNLDNIAASNNPTGSATR